jgi:hypothetical protein
LDQDSGRSLSDIQETAVEEYDLSYTIKDDLPIFAQDDDERVVYEDIQEREERLRLMRLLGEDDETNKAAQRNADSPGAHVNGKSREPSIIPTPGSNTASNSRRPRPRAVGRAALQTGRNSRVAGF